MHLKGCIWKIGQWLLYSLHLDCPDLWAWAGVTLLLSLCPCSSPKNLPFLLSWWAGTRVLLWDCCIPPWGWSHRISLLGSAAFQGGLCSPCSCRMDLHSSPQFPSGHSSSGKVGAPLLHEFQGLQLVAASWQPLSQTWPKAWPPFFSSGTKLPFQRLVFISKHLFSGSWNPFQLGLLQLLFWGVRTKTSIAPNECTATLSANTA